MTKEQEIITVDICGHQGRCLMDQKHVVKIHVENKIYDNIPDLLTSYPELKNTPTELAFIANALFKGNQYTCLDESDEEFPDFDTSRVSPPHLSDDENEIRFFAKTDLNIPFEACVNLIKKSGSYIQLNELD
ncbi:MAG: hypothetical protein H7A37_00020 [Chlamydiales bacterium]|nr:hypothetical protein [Chlamydiia bacterium]MCP5506679.1 hypothetical protein [Chlamydiales bacterium]